MTARDETSSTELSGEAAVKVTWRKGDDGWKASLLTVDEDGFTSTPLQRGRGFALEVTDERRCTGYFSGVGEREPCPGFRRLESGSQCPECRRKDVFSGYVEGRRGADVDSSVEFTVYLARCGGEVKVGVTRRGKLMRRWVEQGADEAVELRSSLTSQEALDHETRLSTEYDVGERVRKEDKLASGDVELGAYVDGLEVDVAGDVVDVAGATTYPSISCSGLERNGRFVGSVESVKGQILSFSDGLCVAVSSGRLFDDVRQTGLTDY